MDWVMPEKANYETYSHKYSQIILLAGSEVDNLLKIVALGYNSGKLPARPTMYDYKKIIMRENKNFEKTEVRFINGDKILPWAFWENISNEDDEPLLWWRTFTDQKHNRLRTESKATLITSMNALAAWKSLLISVSEMEDGEIHPYVDHPDDLIYIYRPEYITETSSFESGLNFCKPLPKEKYDLWISSLDDYL